MGAVTTSITGWNGSVNFLTSLTTGERKSEMKLPRSRPMSRNSTTFRPSSNALPI